MSFIDAYELDALRAKAARVDELENALLQSQNNHHNMVMQNRVLTQRADLPVDRLPVMKEVKALQLLITGLRERNQEMLLALEHLLLCAKRYPGVAMGLSYFVQNECPVEDVVARAREQYRYLQGLEEEQWMHKNLLTHP